MEYISDRIGFKRTEEDLTVHIRATSPKDKKKVQLLQIWLLLWFTAGLIIISQLFFPGYSRDEKLFMVIWIRSDIYQQQQIYDSSRHSWKGR